jgi:hypothetical protein
MNYYINEYYRYPNSKKKFKLIKVTNYIFHFTDNHWCTDNVFMDLIRCKNNIQNYKDIQLKLF